MGAEAFFTGLATEDQQYNAVVEKLHSAAVSMASSLAAILKKADPDIVFSTEKTYLRFRCYSVEDPS